MVLLWNDAHSAPGTQVDIPLQESQENKFVYLSLSLTLSLSLSLSVLGTELSLLLARQTLYFSHIPDCKIPS
jgi:hypothetical protein